MKILELYQDYHIDHATEGQKHGGRGWVNTPCPFCTGNPGYHLGYNTDGDYYHCFRCGGHPVKKVISKLLNVPESQARDIILKYGGVTKRSKNVVKRKIRAKGYKYPTGELNLLTAHLNYLRERNYDPEQLQRTWNLKGTGPIALLDGINYSRRILAPISWDGKEVSFQTRNLLPGGKDNKLKYMACPKDRELIEHQTILYGRQSGWKSRGICVEGITDVWRLGEVSFGVFGIDYTPRQVREMSRRFDSIAVAFDPDPQAIRQANKLVAELKFRGVEAFRVDIPTDPGDMSQDDADHLVKEILTKIY